MKKLASLFIFAAALVIAALPAQAQNTFRQGLTPDGAPTYLRLAPSYIDARVLAGTVSESHTIPTGAQYVIFSSSCAAFYAKIGATAATPAADVTDGTGSELNPAGWWLPGSATQITLISPTACIVTMSFYL